MTTTKTPEKPPGSPVVPSPEGEPTEATSDPSEPAKGKGKGKGSKGPARPPIRENYPKLAQQVGRKERPSPAEPDTAKKPKGKKSAPAETPAPEPEPEPVTAPEPETPAAEAAPAETPAPEPESAPAAEAPRRRGRPPGSGRKSPEAGTALSAPETNALTPAETYRLATLESVVNEGLNKFLAVGTALLEISEKRLFRATHKTYPEYLRERWQISERTARYLSGGAAVVKQLEAAGVEKLPTNQSQTRDLIGVPPEKQAEVWKEACEAAKSEGKTAPEERHVKEAARRATGKAEPEAKAEPRDVARAREFGVIPDDAIVSVTITGRESEGSDEGEKVDIDQPDAEWLAAYDAVRTKLPANNRDLFDADALGYRFVAPHRVTFIRNVSRIVAEAREDGGRLGPYLGRLMAILKKPDPSKWVVCESCEGTGKNAMTGKCLDCKEAGYKAP